jgi:hypothetical protein
MRKKSRIPEVSREPGKDVNRAAEGILNGLLNFLPNFPFRNE